MVLGDLSINFSFSFEMANQRFLFIHKELPQAFIAPSIDEVLEVHFVRAMIREVDVHGHLDVILEETTWLDLGIPVGEGTRLGGDPEGVHEVTGVSLDVKIMLFPQGLQPWNSM